MCIRVATSNTSGRGGSNACFDVKDGRRGSGTLQSLVATLRDEKGVVLGRVAVAVSTTSVSTASFAVQGVDGSNRVAGTDVDLPSGAVRLFVEELDAATDAEVSVVAGGA